MSEDASEYVISMEMLESFYDEPGEHGWILEGSKHGLSSTSAIITETAPNGGPPLHTHNSEEIHVLPVCRMAYLIGDTSFEVEGPAIIRIPPNLPHTFVNRGTEPARLVCFFPYDSFWTNYEEVGANPLLSSF
jgi:mannose-6-phosphate isomerase-like protein (cupin superfamily)